MSSLETLRELSARYKAKGYREPEMLTAAGAERILVSVSGGRSSMYMAKRIRENWFPDRAHRAMLKFVFANTGKEREETLPEFS